MILAPERLRMLREDRDDSPGNRDGGNSGSHTPDGTPEIVDELAPDHEGRALRCVSCHHIITWSSQRMEWGGQHRHVFFNPYGLVFELGCFAKAQGCGVTGLPSDSFSWFSGHAWQVALCGKCLLHMGWLYRPISTGGRFFFGLILDNLVEDEA